MFRTGAFRLLANSGRKILYDLSWTTAPAKQNALPILVQSSKTISMTELAFGIWFVADYYGTVKG